MEVEDFMKMDKDARDQYLEGLSSTIETAKNLKLLAASIDKRSSGISAKANEYQYTAPSKGKGNITTKQFNLMKIMTGSQPITSWDDDVQPNIQRPKFYGGTAQDKTASDKVALELVWQKI